MYTLMIVEDELLARLALKNSVEWEKYNIQEVLEAKDGLEALEKYKKNKPDILVVDINIPFMNGIELIKEIRKLDTHAKIIILSCMADFGYAKDAINAGVSQYILKASMSIEEIESAIQSAIDELNRDKSKNKKEEVPSEGAKEKRAMLRRLVTGKNLEGITEQIFDNPFLLAVFQAEFLDEAQISSQELLNRMNLVKNIISSAIDVEYSSCVIDLQEQQYAAYIEVTGKNKEFVMDEVKHLLTNAVQLIQKYTSARARAGVSDIGTGQNQIGEYFRMAQKRLGYLYFCEDSVSMGHDKEKLQLLTSYWEEAEKQFTQELNALGLIETSAFLEEWPQYSPHYLAAMQNYWIEMMNRVSVEWEVQKRQNIMELTLMYAKKMRAVQNFTESKEVFAEFLTGIRQLPQNRTRYSEVVEKAIAYAENHFDKPITLNDAAEAIPVSSNHLSMLFRKEYGINYTDFIIGLRMEKAKMLLETSNRKLFEIAEDCGFNDHAYFTRTFKKHVGVSPYEYRKQVSFRGEL